MRKIRILALLSALTLLYCMGACKKEKGSDGDGTPAPPPQSSIVINGEGGSSPSTDSGEISDAQEHMAVKGYPLGFTLYVCGEGGYGFDTADSTVFCGNAPKTFDFTSMLPSLYQEMTEHNIYSICSTASDLTYRTITGTDPTGANEVYRLTFTDNGTTYTVTTDKAAIENYAAGHSDLADLAALLVSFSGLARVKYA